MRLLRLLSRGRVALVAGLAVAVAAATVVPLVARAYADALGSPVAASGR